MPSTSLDRCAALGARVIKVHPPAQHVDPGDARYRPFFSRVAHHGVVLMIHTGSEHAAATSDARLTDPDRLRPALDEGCTVIAAHAAMGSFLDAEPFRTDLLKRLAGLAAHYPRLYCDTAVLASVFRWRALPMLLRETALAGRILYASDWPFTSNALVFWNRLRPTTTLSLAAERNLFRRDAELQLAIGLPLEAMRRGLDLFAPMKRT